MADEYEPSVTLPAGSRDDLGEAARLMGFSTRRAYVRDRLLDALAEDLDKSRAAVVSHHHSGDAGDSDGATND